GVVDELFAHRPSQALDRPAVDLAFHLWWVDGAARVLDRGVAGEAIRAGLAVDGDPAEVHCEGGRLAIDPGPALAEHRGPGGAAHRQLADPDPPVGDALDLHRTVADLEILGSRLQLVGGDLENLAARVRGGRRDREADGAGGDAAARHRSLGCAGGVTELDLDLLDGHSEDLGRDHRQPCAGAADVDSPDLHGEGSVGLHATAGGRRTDSAAPAADGHAETLAGSAGSRVERVPASRLQHLDEADRGPLAAGQLLPLAARVAQAQLDRVHFQLRGQLVERRLEDEEG